MHWPCCLKQAQRAYLAPEERELRDVERQMEEELVASHMDADRVIAVRADPDGTLRYLVKARGVPSRALDVACMHPLSHVLSRMRA